MRNEIVNKFSILVLYRINSGTITAPVNILGMNTWFTIKYNPVGSLTEIYFLNGANHAQTCTLSHAFSSGHVQDDWTFFATTYDGSMLRGYKWE